MKFKAVKAGTAVITLENIELADGRTTPLNIDKLQKNITITEKNNNVVDNEKPNTDGTDSENNNPNSSDTENDTLPNNGSENSSDTNLEKKPESNSKPDNNGKDNSTAKLPSLPQTGQKSFLGFALCVFIVLNVIVLFRKFKDN